MLLDCASTRYVRYFQICYFWQTRDPLLLSLLDRQVMVRNLCVLRTFLLALLSFLTGTRVGCNRGVQLPDNWARLRAFGYLADNLMGVRPGPGPAWTRRYHQRGGRGFFPPLLPDSPPVALPGTGASYGGPAGGATGVP